MSEKIGGAKGTELDDEFVEMEKVCLTVPAFD